MRKKDILLEALPDVLLLCQYLYLDGGHSVTVPGKVPGTKIRLRMGEDLRIETCQLIGGEWFSGAPLSMCDGNLIAGLHGVMECLKQLPPEQYPDAFDTRYDEVKMIAQSNVSLNYFNRRC